MKTLSVQTCSYRLLSPRRFVFTNGRSGFDPMLRLARPATCSPDGKDGVELLQYYMAALLQS